MLTTGAEPFHGSNFLLERTLLDFWCWSSSDLVGNALRGVLAEYIVSCALDLPTSLRVEWDAFDLKMPNGLKIEVKSAAYLQSWNQKAFSKITFGIAPTRAWDEDSASHSQEVRRQADIYIFCLLHHQDKATVDPLDMDQWTFYVLPTSVLDERLPTQKTIGLANLLKMKPCQVTYGELANAVKNMKIKEDLSHGNHNPS